MENNEICNVNTYVNRLIENRNFRKYEYKKYISNDYGINDITGYIDSDVLNKVIRYAKKNRKVRVMLSDILLYVNSSSMTDENFQMLLHFPIKYRRTYLSNICHAELSFYQMQILNRYPLTLEAFTWLFNNICCYDCFSEEDMLNILRENPDVKPVAIRACIDLALEQYGESEKIRVAVKWIGS